MRNKVMESIARWDPRRRKWIANAKVVEAVREAKAYFRKQMRRLHESAFGGGALVTGEARRRLYERRIDVGRELAATERELARVESMRERFRSTDELSERYEWEPDRPEEVGGGGGRAWERGG